MATFTCQARRVVLEEHPNADAIELARVDGYVSIVKKGEFKNGELAIYIPEAAILPIGLLEEMNLLKCDRETGEVECLEDGTPIGGLAGREGRRLKPVRLRGIFSQGLLYKPSPEVISAFPEGELVEDRDYADDLGIEKWIPEVPLAMSGKAYSCYSIETYTDIENIKRYPDVFEVGEEVVATEKLHGSCTVVTLDLSDDTVHVSSKGMSARKLALEDEKDEGGSSKNVYWRAVHELGLDKKLRDIALAFPNPARICLYGEVLGVQDLMYGHTKGQLGFAAFDISVDGEYLDVDYFNMLMDANYVPRVPPLYRGPYDEEKLWEIASGLEQYTGREAHMREGIVVRPVHERRDDLSGLGRVCLKFVSEVYLLRKNKDATEFE